MTKEELKNKCTERAKIFQQAMYSNHSSNPIDCIEWFADRIAELEKENLYYKDTIETNTAEWEEQGQRVVELEQENAELKSIVRETKAVDESFAKLQQENAELKLKLEALEGQTPWKDIKDKSEVVEQLTKAKDLLLRFVELKNKPCASEHSINMLLYENICAEAEQFLKDSEVEK